jgi:hypothetical protein
MQLIVHFLEAFQQLADLAISQCKARYFGALEGYTVKECSGLGKGNAVHD